MLFGKDETALEMDSESQTTLPSGALMTDAVTKEDVAEKVSAIGVEV